MTTKALAITAAAVAAAVWLGTGFNVSLGSHSSRMQVNPFTHSVTMTSDYKFPASGNDFESAGAMLGMALVRSSGMCEQAAVKIPGWGWRATIEASDGSPIMSCWTWR